ncbi:MAG: gamma-glutamylcyclotransferase family protein [Planctomycetota bacterium]|jgi:gamma-glutamylcyclotransferase (GGCT)/AIG2-like uncharacterized protein YtfP
MTVRIVVYGLLRRGARMNNLLDGAEFLSEVVVDGYQLFDLGDYPGAVPGEGVIIGELYELASPAVLDLLDEAERVEADPPLYRRVLVEADGAPAWLYVWAGPVEESGWITSGDWFRR